MKEILKPIAALFLVCLVVSALLALTNYYTAPVIAENEGAKADVSRKLVLPYGERFSPVAISAEDLSEHGITEVYAAENGAGYAVTAAVPGYHGEITVMFGILPDGTISGVEVLSHSETQGLGERIATEEFRSQFVNQRGALTLVKGGASGPGQIDALAGATVSSSAMVNAANGALAVWELAREVRP